MSALCVYLHISLKECSYSLPHSTGSASAQSMFVFCLYGGRRNEFLILQNVELYFKYIKS